MASFPGQKAGAGPTVPTTPSNLIATPLQTVTPQIQLQWNPSLDGDVPITYTISRCTGVSCTSFTVLTTTAPNAVGYLDTNVLVGSSYSYTIQGADAAGNTSGVSNISSAIVPDLTPPTVPANFVATTVSPSEIDLTWTASTDPDDGVSFYTLFRNPPGGFLIRVNAPATSYNDTGLAAATTYLYNITATDTHGNTSGPASASADTGDTIPPTVPTNFVATPVSPSEIDLSWTASTDNDAVSRYNINRTPGPLFVTVNAPNTTFNDTGLSGLTTYNYTISATDNHGNTSGTAPASATTLDAPPNTPTNFTAVAVGGSEIDLSWTASTDPDDAVVSYTITRSPPGGTLTGVLAPATTYRDLELSSFTTYSYTISATDAHGATSGTAPASATTQDVTAPTIPGNFVATPVSTSQINLSWSASTDAGAGVSLYTLTINPGNVIVQISAPTTTYQDVGLASATTYTFTVSATDNAGNTSGTNSTSATTQSLSTSLNFPRVAVVANGGDQSYGQTATAGFTSYTASGPGTAAYNACQFLGSFDAVYPLGGSFEGFQASNRTKQNLVQAIKGLGSFPNVKNASRTPYVFLYCIMESSQNAASGLPYQRFANLIAANNWWTYESAGGAGTIQPAGASGFFEVNYSYAWNTAVGSAARDASICGHVYGALSSGQGPAQSAATYFSSALLTTNVLDSRFTGLTNGAAPNADGLFLDNCFIFPNGGGGLSPASSSWDGLGLQSNAAIAAYPSGASSLIARGQQKFFATMQTYLASCNPGSTYYSIGNFGSYANTVGNGNINGVTASAMASTLHGGLIEDTFGSGGNALQSFQTFAQVITNYNFGMDFCLAPKLAGIHARLPATDGSSTATWRINGVATTVSTGTAAEYQCMRAALCTALMDNGFFAIGTSGNIWQTVRYYDEFGDDSLAQVNVKRGYLGQPTGARASAAFLNGVWGRKFTGGLVLVNPWLNGSQTITAAQLTTAFGGTYKRLSGTQQPAVNSGAAFTSYTFSDPDGLILLNVAVVNPTITTATPLPGATQATAYSTTVAATGGSTPYTWSIDSDTPNTGSWLTINSSTGVLSGTPGTAETETVVVRVTGTDGGTSTKTFSLTVSPAAGGTGFVAAGHFINAKMPMAAVHPRPDSETGAFTSTVYARHRWAYFDGTNSVQYQVPIGVQGGARPLVWQLTAGPAGATISNGGLGNSSDGIVTWTPTSAVSTSAPVTFTVLVTDQQHNTITISWTTATSSSTSQFVFVSPTGSAGNTGAIGSPKTLASVMGATPTTTTNPGALVYMRSGAYQWLLQTGAPIVGSTALDKAHNPISYLCFPGESVNIDASTTQLFDNGSGSTDMFFSGSTTSTMTITGSSATSPDTHTFELYNPSRVTFWNIAFVNPINRVSASGLTNSTSIFSFNDSSGGLVGKNFWYMKGCSETGRSGAANNSMTLFALFSTSNIVVENCTTSGTAGFGPFFKDSNQNVTVFNCRFDLSPGNEGNTSGAGFLFGGQQGESPVIRSQNCEVCYTFIKGGATKFDFQGGATCGPMFSYRNVIYRQDTNEPWALGSNAPAGQGPFSSDGDVLIAKSPGGIQTTGSVPFSSTLTEIQVPWSGTAPPANNPINTTTGALVNATTQWRTLYLFTHGIEIG